MLFDSGRFELFEVTETRVSGDMPKPALAFKDRGSFSDRQLGYSRVYAARSAGCQIDRLIRVWSIAAKAGDVVVIDGDQYRVDLVQPTIDENGLKVTDLTLVRMGDLYDIAEDQEDS